MDTPEKNAHLSPLLLDIKDYGPGELPAAEQPVGENPQSPPSEVSGSGSDPDRPPVVPRHTAESGGRPWRIYGLLLLWLITLGLGFAAFVWQQTRVDELRASLAEAREQTQKAMLLAERQVDEGPGEPLSTFNTDLATIESVPEVAEPGVEEPAVETEQSTAPTPEYAQQAAEPEQQDPAPAPGQQDALPEPQTAALEPPALEQQAQAPEQAASPLQEAEIPAQTPAQKPATPQTVEQTAAAPGAWFVNLSTLSTEASARRWLNNLPDAPATAHVAAIERDGKTLYRVRIGGLQSREEALRAAEHYGNLWPVASTWVSRD